MCRKHNTYSVFVPVVQSPSHIHCVCTVCVSLPTVVFITSSSSSSSSIQPTVSPSVVTHMIGCALSCGTLDRTPLHGASITTGTADIHEHRNLLLTCKSIILATVISETNKLDICTIKCCQFPFKARSALRGDKGTHSHTTPPPV